MHVSFSKALVFFFCKFFGALNYRTIFAIDPYSDILVNESFSSVFMQFLKPEEIFRFTSFKKR